MAGDGAELTLIAPDPDFAYRPLAVAEPFSLGRAQRVPLQRFADFVGLFDSGGVFFIQGHVERPQDRLATALSFRWVLEGERLVPLTVNDALDDRIDVSPSVRIGGQIVAFAEIWRISPLTR
jgi:hypothetical protein